MDLRYYKMLSSDYSNKIIKGVLQLLIAMNEFACLCVPDFSIVTEPSLDLKL